MREREGGGREREREGEGVLMMHCKLKREGKVNIILSDLG